jgi:hypothetical protein
MRTDTKSVVGLRSINNRSKKIFHCRRIFYRSAQNDRCNAAVAVPWGMGKGKMAAEAAIVVFRKSRLVARSFFTGASIRFDDALSRRKKGTDGEPPASVRP